MADTKISDMTAAVSVADADLVPVVQGGVNKKATVDLILDALTAARVATAIGSTAANLVYAGPASGAAAVPAARALVAADIPSLSAVYQPVDPTLTALAALASTGLLEQTGVDTFAYRALGVGASTSIPTRADADTRYAALAHAHVTGDVTGLDAALAGLQPLDATLTALAALATLGAANQIIRTNAGATALEWADPAGGISGLTAGVIPVATSGTAIGNSKLAMSGGSLGTATLYDDGGTGVSTLIVRAGANQSTNDYILFADSAGGNTAGLRRTADNHLTVTDGAGGLGRLRAEMMLLDASGLVGFYGTGGDIHIYSGAGAALFKVTAAAFRVAANAAILFSSGAGDPGATANIGLARSADGILAVTDGSTGYGRLLAGTLGVNNSAAGSTPGTCVKKLEIFDAAGASLGFVPVYDAIT